jgi:hypothetical protein
VAWRSHWVYWRGHYVARVRSDFEDGPGKLRKRVVRGDVGYLMGGSGSRSAVRTSLIPSLPTVLRSWANSILEQDRAKSNTSSDEEKEEPDLPASPSLAVTAPQRVGERVSNEDYVMCVSSSVWVIFALK